jgi:hypothetical protein
MMVALSASSSCAEMSMIAVNSTEGLRAECKREKAGSRQRKVVVLLKTLCARRRDFTVSSSPSPSLIPRTCQAHVARLQTRRAYVRLPGLVTEPPQPASAGQRRVVFRIRISRLCRALHSLFIRGLDYRPGSFSFGIAGVC